MSGSITSRMIRSGSSSRTAEIAWAPLPTARTAKPAKRRLVVSRSLMLGSSSTIRILGPSVMALVSARLLDESWESGRGTLVPSRTCATRKDGAMLRAARDYWRPLFPRAADYASVRRTWRGDLLAGLTVGIVALPLALAFGVSSGAGAESGLLTAIGAGRVAAVFGGPNIQVSGPTGAMVVVLEPVVAAHGPGVVVVVSVLAGAIVLLAGLLKIGRVVAFIPWPVIEGFTLGIAVI